MIENAQKNDLKVLEMMGQQISAHAEFKHFLRRESKRFVQEYYPGELEMIENVQKHASKVLEMEQQFSALMEFKHFFCLNQNTLLRSIFPES